MNKIRLKYTKLCEGNWCVWDTVTKQRVGKMYLTETEVKEVLIKERMIAGYR